MYSYFKALASTRLLSILLLGFTSGLPLVLTGSTLQAWYTEAGISVLTIGALSLLGLPYILKFLWAPIMDYFSIPKLGKRKGWILLTQLGLVITLFILAQLNPLSHGTVMALVALAIAFFSASQDISINAYQTDVLHPEERGLGASYYVFTYRLATLISGGLALVMADYLGWKLTYEIMAALIAISMLLTYKIPVVKEFKQVGNLFSTTFAAIANLFSREKIVWLLLFIMFYKFGDALAQTLLTNFLLRGLGFTLTEVGLAYKAVSFIATVIGAFIGGVCLLRWNIYSALLVFGIAQAFSNLTFALLAFVGKNFSLMVVSIFIENFCAGLSTAALLAFMMFLCDHRYTATQFALLSAIAAIGRVFLGPLAGLMVAEIGWVQFYIWTFILCIPGILFLMLLKDRVLSHASAATD